MGYPENSYVVFCPNKQRSLEPFMCLDLRLSLKKYIYILFYSIFLPHPSRAKNLLWGAIDFSWGCNAIRALTSPRRC